MIKEMSTRQLENKYNFSEDDIILLKKALKKTDNYTSVLTY